MRANATTKESRKATAAVVTVISIVTAAPFRSCGNRSSGGTWNRGVAAGAGALRLAEPFRGVIRRRKLVLAVAVLRDDLEHLAGGHHLRDLGIKRRLQVLVRLAQAQRGVAVVRVALLVDHLLEIGDTLHCGVVGGLQDLVELEAREIDDIAAARL